MKISLIVSDMDGTLLGRDPSFIPPENAAAMKAAARAGIHIAICSGRLPDDISQQALDAGLPEMEILALNGTCALRSPLGGMAWSVCMPEETARRLTDRLIGLGIRFAVFSGHLIAETFPAGEKPSAEMYWGSHFERRENRSRILYGLEGRERALHEGVNKIVLRDETGRYHLPELTQELRRSFPELDFSSSWPDNMEIVPKGIDKGWAVTRLAGRLGIPMDEVMCIGDQDNDLPMLRVAGCPVAMGNASPGVLAAADWIAPEHTDLGVAAAIRGLALEERIPGIRKKGT